MVPDTLQTGKQKGCLSNVQARSPTVYVNQEVLRVQVRASVTAHTTASAPTVKVNPDPTAKSSATKAYTSSRKKCALLQWETDHNDPSRERSPRVTATTLLKSCRGTLWRQSAQQCHCDGGKSLPGGTVSRQSVHEVFA